MLIGFRVASENIKSINSLFLKTLENNLINLNICKDKIIIEDEKRFSHTIDMLNSVCNTFIHFSSLFSQYKHLIQKQYQIGGIRATKKPASAGFFICFLLS